MINEYNYTEMVNSPDSELVVKCEILSSDEDQNATPLNLENNSSDDKYNDTDSFTKSIENLPVELLNNTNYVIAKKENTIHLPVELLNNTNYVIAKKENTITLSNSSDIVDNFVNSNDCAKSNDCVITQISLEDALNESKIYDSDDDLICDQLIEDLKENCSTSQIHSNLPNLKRKVILSNTFKRDDNSSYDIKKVYSCCKKNKKSQTIAEIAVSDDCQRQQLKTPQEILVDLPNIFTNQFSIVEENTKKKRFLQNGNCLSLPKNIEKCIECRRIHKMKKKITKHDSDNISCRFYAFRLLKYSKLGKLSVAGFPDPYKSPNDTDLNKWLPDSEHSSTPSSCDVQAAIKILEDTGDQFCEFVRDEKEALLLTMSNDRKKNPEILWKKCVNGIREMCDVCKTSIFNYHWSCGECGFVVCVDCFRTKLDGIQINSMHNLTNNYNKKKWLLCSNEEEHNVHKLSITQMLTGDVLNQIWKLMHSTSTMHGININCKCMPKLENSKPLGMSIDLVTDTFLDGVYGNHIISDKNNQSSNLFALMSDQDFSSVTTSETEEIKYQDTHYSTIPNKNIQDKNHSEITYMGRKKVFASKLSLMSDNKTNIPYTWLCNGRLLRLLDPKNDNNYELFQEQWKRGQPVLVSHVGNSLNSMLWHPESFSRDFGDQKNDIIDCTTSQVFNDHPMCKFWDGFENVAGRLCDKQGNPMLLKLKDWPPSADFAEILPDRFQDLMNCLPLKEYTHRTGLFNLASRLPECFVRPDLGPKMYTAYGNAGTKYEKVSTTNLHLDMTDAVNVMVYVAITKNCEENDYDWYVKEALKVIEEAGCDDLTMERINMHGEIPGALWHIYEASDAAAIRDLLIKVEVEQGKLIEESGDPIHDQSHYLDYYFRERLYREYGIKGYAIVQFYGDAVFIPAGAPHQVRNLHNCIKVAEDFVSPENVHHSFHMTQEFRNLTDSHTNHEDKLQIKNIIYHAVKDSISVLLKKKNL